MTGGAAQRQTLLIVDDVRDNIKVLANLLRDQARILVATDGETALHLAAAEPIDGILLDIMMPTLDGYEVCRRLKADPATHDIPVIFVTVLDESTDEEAGLRLGAFDYIARPFVPAIVRARVGNMLRLQATTQGLRRANAQLKEMAATDALTGAVNRRQFFILAEHERVRCLRARRPLSLAMLDVDHFKSINDTYGHAAGDQVLIGLVAEACRLLRQSDVVARLGGEEFAVLLPETGRDDALASAERLRAGIPSLSFNAGADTFSVTASVGVALIADEDDDIDAALKRADVALYEAKRGGRNQVRFGA